jgi:hypothetical protein
MKIKQQTTNPSANTQSFLEIDHIQNGLVFMKDGSIRKVIMTSSMNFSLRSEGEQDMLISQFQEMINSLDYPIQILVQSRRVALNKYLENIKAIGGRTTDEYAKIHIEEYTSFLGEIVEKANVMDKKFFVIIPYFFPTIEAVKSGSPDNRAIDVGVNFLNQRAVSIESNLKNMGINCLPLDTEGLIELYYISYNPGTIKLTNAGGASSLNRPVVETQFLGGREMNV